MVWFVLDNATWGNTCTRWTFSLWSFCAENVAYKRKLQSTWSLNVNVSIRKRLTPIVFNKDTDNPSRQPCQEGSEICKAYGSPWRIYRGIKPSISIWEHNKSLWLICKRDILLNWRKSKNSTETNSEDMICSIQP